MTTSTPQVGANDPNDLATLRATGGGNIPVTQAPPQKKTDPKLHYGMCISVTVIGIIVAVLGFLGLGESSVFHDFYPYLILFSLFFILPGIVGIYRGPGEPSTHVIPRPKNRKPIDPTAGAGGAAGPAPAV